MSGKRLGRDASVHAATVARLGRGERLRMPTRVPRRVEVAPVTSLQVHPMVWQAALELAGGDVRRVEVVDESTVRVVNRPG